MNPCEDGITALGIDRRTPSSVPQDLLSAEAKDKDSDPSALIVFPAFVAENSETLIMRGE